MAEAEAAAVVVVAVDAAVAAVAAAIPAAVAAVTAVVVVGGNGWPPRRDVPALARREDRHITVVGGEAILAARTKVAVPA